MEADRDAGWFTRLLQTLGLRKRPPDRDKVLQRQAWKVAEGLGGETTYDAEYVALAKLQADVFVTSDEQLAQAVSGLVETATIDALARPERRPEQAPRSGERRHRGPVRG